MRSNKYLLNLASNHLSDVLDQLCALSMLFDHFDLASRHEKRAYAFLTDSEKWLSTALTELRLRVQELDAASRTKE